MLSVKIEFAVQMTCNGCVESIKKSLSNTPGINNIEVDLKRGSVVVDSTLSTLEIQKKIESTGKKVVVRGYEGNSCGVAVLESGIPNIQGVVRFVQAAPGSCVIDGTVDGLTPNNKYQINIHECGDISQGCNNIGEIFNPEQKKDNNYGELGSIQSDNTGRANFRLENSVLHISSVIGRSFAISQQKQRLVCGIIARSAGLFENPKTICACDGVTIWNEKIPPKSTL